MVIIALANAELLSERVCNIIIVLFRLRYFCLKFLVKCDRFCRLLVFVGLGRYADTYARISALGFVRVAQLFGAEISRRVDLLRIVRLSQSVQLILLATVFLPVFPIRIVVKLFCDSLFAVLRKHGFDPTLQFIGLGSIAYRSVLSFEEEEPISCHLWHSLGFLN